MDTARCSSLPIVRSEFSSTAHVTSPHGAGATIPLVDKTFTPDKALVDVSDGDTGAGLALLASFPYLGTPYDGYYTPS